MKRVGVIGRFVVLGGLLSAIAYLGLHRDLLQHSLLERELLRFGRLAPIFFVLVYAVATTLFMPGFISPVLPAAPCSARCGGRFGISRARPWGDSGLSDCAICRFGLGFKSRRRTAGSPDGWSGARRMAFCGVCASGPTVSI